MFTSISPDTGPALDAGPVPVPADAARRWTRPAERAGVLAAQGRDGPAFEIGVDSRTEIYARESATVARLVDGLLVCPWSDGTAAQGAYTGRYSSQRRT